VDTHAEFKQVTVLFADVVHSMSIAAAVGAERLREIMTDLANRCAAVVQRYGGTVDKFTGDGVMAVFGAPVALEDHALRACLAYVREWLGSMVTAAIVDFDPATGSYSLPAEHAVCLTGEGSLNLAPFSQIVTMLAKFVEPVSGVFRSGGGVGYDQFRPEFTDVMDGLSRGLFDEQLIDGMIPATGLAAALASGIRVADIGCGTGHSTNVLARAFPASTFVGYDIADDALQRARTEAVAMGVTNVSFELCDVTALPATPAFDAIFAFDMVHDQVDPAAVLHQAHAALAPGGVFVMMDIKASSRVEENVENPFAPMLYALSTLHCLTVSLAYDGAGLGTVWGEQLARRMLADAGFTDVAVFDVPDDPLDQLYVARKAAA
jgi:SAM-dependent methyltransferase